MKKNEMKAIVTGSSGFVGKTLIKKLKQKGWKIVPYSRSKGQDILNQTQLREATKGCSVFFHLAAELEEDKPLSVLRETNVQGTKNAFLAAKENQCSKFILLSSVGVYGRFDEQALEDFPYNPLTNYELSKTEAEQFLIQQKGMKIIIARSALVLGANKYWKEIVKTIQKSFPLIGSGNNKWQIIYIDDLVDALILLAESNQANGIYNVAEEPSQAKTLKELVELIQKKIGKNQEVKHIPVWIGKGVAHGLTFFASLQGKKTLLRPEYIDRLLKNRHYSIEKIKKLGWKPKNSIQQAVQKTINTLKKEK